MKHDANGAELTAKIEQIESLEEERAQTGEPFNPDAWKPLDTLPE